MLRTGGRSSPKAPVVSVTLCLGTALLNLSLFFITIIVFNAMSCECRVNAE